MPKKTSRKFLALFLAPTIATSSLAATLEEVIVTAQKREEDLQKIPTAISVLGSDQLKAQRITGLDSLQGAVPSLEVQPWGNTQNTLVIAGRGGGPIDAAGVTRSGAVAVNIDGYYLARPQSLALDVLDLDRIEVLRGPQGTLFGRNATGGTVNLISRKPTIGKFEFEQTFGIGNYDQQNITTRANLPISDTISVKADYAARRHDGWVKNTAVGEHDFGERNDEGGRIAIRFQPNEDLDMVLAVDKLKAEATMLYYTVYKDNGGLFGNERDRPSKSRRPVEPLDPSITHQLGYSLTTDWNISPNLSAKFLLGCRELREETGGNYAGVLYYNGFIANVDTDQHQCSQEATLVGHQDSIEWSAGLYHFGEGAHQNTQNRFSLDQFGILTGVPWTPINPPTTVDLFTGQVVPPRLVKVDTESSAIYGQMTWTPPIAENRLHVTVGARYTKDRMSGNRMEYSYQKFDLSQHSTDGTVALAYDLAPEASVYVKWSSAYRAGGVNPASVTLQPYESEKTKSIETGLKSQFLDNRARLNVALFRTLYNHMQIDVQDPASIVLTQTINAERTVRIEGVEVEALAMPLDGLQVGVSYTYLRGVMPLQPNTLENGTLEQFYLTQTPRHAGAATVDYTFSPWSIGTLTLHADVTSTDHYAHTPQDTRTDAYTLTNLSASLYDIPLGDDYGKLRLTGWVKNVFDQEYIVLAYPNPPVDIVQQFGQPRTYGAEVSYRY